MRQKLAQQLQTLRRIVLLSQLMPVTFAPGRLRLATKPSFTGSPPVAKTIGMTAVAALAATPDAVTPVATMTVTCRRTRSAARTGNRSYWPSDQRYSIATLRPSM